MPASEIPTTGSLDETKHGVSAVPVEDVLLRRWSPRAFADKALSEADLKSIFTAASWAASSMNEQPWRFVVGRRGDPVWQKISDALAPFNQVWANAAPVLYATFAKKTFSHNGAPNGVAVHDLGAASANASLQAAALGLHVHGMGAFDRAKLQAALSVPEDFEPVACWALGYRGDPEALADPLKAKELEPRTRKELDETVFSNWGEPGIQS